MKGVAAIALLWSATALAEQPRGTYTLDRGEWMRMTDSRGQPFPSCGGAKPFGGQATFVVEYKSKILVNRRDWRFYSYAAVPKRQPPLDAAVVVVDPQDDRIMIWFMTDGSDAGGFISVTGTRNGMRCYDAWQLHGAYAR